MYSKIISPNCELSFLPQYSIGTFESWLLTIVAQLASHCGCPNKIVQKLRMQICAKNGIISSKFEAFYKCNHDKHITFYSFILIEEPKLVCLKDIMTL